MEGDAASGKSTILRDGIMMRRAQIQYETQVDLLGVKENRSHDESVLEGKSIVEIANRKSNGDATVNVGKANENGGTSAMSSYLVSLMGCHSAEDVQTIIENKLEKKMAQTFAPRNTQRLVYVLDDMNIPTPDHWGTRPVCELLLQIVKEQGLYSMAKAGDWSSFEGIELAGTMVTNSRCKLTSISSRITGRMHIIAVDSPTEAVIVSIFSKILHTQAQAQGGITRTKLYTDTVCRSLIKAITDVLGWAQKRFLSSPLHPWLTFSTRDLRSIVTGMNLASSSGCK